MQELQQKQVVSVFLFSGQYGIRQPFISSCVRPHTSCAQISLRLMGTQPLLTGSPFCVPGSFPILTIGGTVYGTGSVEIL